MTTVCRRCSALLPRKPGAGRRAAYCSNGCRRAAEYEAKRVQNALDGVEHVIRSRTLSPTGTANAEIIRAHEAERDRLELRLREVLDDTPIPADGHPAADDHEEES
jgi:hypothetical protein